MRAGIALGSNLGERVENLTKARAAISALPQIAEPFLSSAIYETEPIDCEPGAGKFLNAVLEIGYDGSSRRLLRELQKIETALGRPTEHAQNQSRSIDLDLLYHGSEVSHERDLQLPHPRLHQRGFVLHPLAEIQPDLILPGQTKTVRELSETLPKSPSVVRATRQW
ncbi:MAG: 2-amino-4-hydroxy-6-hydroxymethyldihydropteridine diphosphokinase [Chthoniobacterales bacterium]